MNEFVRRPSRRRDTKVYVPAADIIKRTIRRSWTISNPTPRWPTCRNSIEARPYNSLPKGQNISDYPSLVVHPRNSKNSTDTPPISSEIRRTASEDVYQEPLENLAYNKEPARLHPMMATSLQNDSVRQSQKNNLYDSEPSDKDEKGNWKDKEKHVAFQRSDRAGIQNTSVLACNLDSTKDMPCNEKSLPGNEKQHRTNRVEAVQDNPVVELCDIEPFSGTVFRKMTVRRRRQQQNVKKVSSIDAGWRRSADNDFLDILLPDGEDYRLVFVNSDSSSKEEDIDDNDSSSASSFPIDECDWDYFEPGTALTQHQVFGLGSPFGSPRECRKRIINSPLGSPLSQRRPRIKEPSDEDVPGINSPKTTPSIVTPPASTANLLQQQCLSSHRVDQTSRPLTSCKTCGSCNSTPAQFIPVPVPIPIPFPVPWGFNVPSSSNLVPIYKNLCRGQSTDFWQCFNGNSGSQMHPGFLPWSFLEKSMIVNQDNNIEKTIEIEAKDERDTFGHLNSENRPLDSDSSSDEDATASRSYDVTASDNEDCRESSGHSSTDDEKEREEAEEEESSSSHNSDSDCDDKSSRRRFSKVFVVNHRSGSLSEEGSSHSGSTTTSDNDTDTEMDCTVVLVKVKPLNDTDIKLEGPGKTKFLKTRKKKAKKSVIVSCEKVDCNKTVNNEEKGSHGKTCALKDDQSEMPAAGPESDEIFFDSLATNNQYCSSPGLSDVSAESLLSSSDVEKESISSQSRTLNNSTTRKKTTNEETGSESETATDLGSTSSQAGIFTSGASVERQQLQQVDGSGGGAGGKNIINNSNNGAKYTSLVMITNDVGGVYREQVNVVTSDTTTVIDGEDVVVVVSHTNEQDDLHQPQEEKEKADWEDDGEENENTLAVHDGNEERKGDNNNGTSNNNNVVEEQQHNVTVITSSETLSAFEEGLADDDSWVEDNLSNNEEDEDDFPTNSSSGDEVMLTCSAIVDQEDELRGYHRAAIDFTLHTIVEESCEESEVEQMPKKTQKERPQSATDLEKYFFFGLGDGTSGNMRDDAFSETSSIYSEGVESLGPEDGQSEDPEELASSRLEKYFLSGFMGFQSERKDSDGSVGSDSEGKPSPEQRRKRLVRSRGTGRSHSNSLDNLLGNPDLAGSEQQLEMMVQNNNSEESSSSDSDTYDENGFGKGDTQFDTVKRKKGKKLKASLEDVKNLETPQEENLSEEDDERNKTPQPEINQQQSRDSGFVGSCDDLLKDHQDSENTFETTMNIRRISEPKILPGSLPPATNLTRKDSFNNWSSDEETNLMMSKMRQFFKSMVASSSKPLTSNVTSPKPRPKTRCKPPQLVYFENELTRLMKTVPGIRDDQVREIVEYLSSEDTWSDSYDSSDYTSSDLEGACTKSALQQQISDSCKQIINKFDNNAEDEEGDAGDGGILDDSHKETAFVYQKLVASFEKIATEGAESDPKNSPPLIAKVMHHIGSRLVALMHEVSSGESHSSSSPKGRSYHRRLHHKLSNASTTTDDESASDSNLLGDTIPNLLPRSKSHDLLMGDVQKTVPSLETGEEREVSDCERFSWRGSFESALLATDSRNKLSLIGGEGSASASALAIVAKRRSAGDLLFSHKSLSREQLDRVRSCGSIGGNVSEDKLWVTSTNKTARRRSSVPDATSSGGSADGEDEDEDLDEGTRATLPRSIQTGPQTTNSLPRLPTTSVPTLQKAQSHHFLSQNVKSARYRPPGFTRIAPAQPKRALSAPGLQFRRGRRIHHSSNMSSDELSLSEAHSSPMLTSRTASKSATPSPIAPGSRRKTQSVSSQEWPLNEDDADRLATLQQNRVTLSTFGLRSDSMVSVYSGADDGRYGSVIVRGQVEFGLQYNYKAGALEIQIKQCKDLASVDAKRNRSDPYVKVYLLPDKSKSGKRKTKVKKHTLNPIFDECLKFHMSLNELELRTLWLSVWHSDMFGKNDFLGEVMMTLENKVFDDPTPKWYNLQERTLHFDDTVLSYKGDIIVCLKFVPPDMTVHKKGKKSRGALHILVKEAKALCAIKANGTSDPFCKSYLLPDKGRNAKQKTPVVKKTVNPMWNHTFIYDNVTLQELSERSLELTVWDHDRYASNEFLGMVRFSLGTGKHYGKSVDWMDSTGKELNLWKNMLEKPNFWVEGSLPLRSSAGSTRVT
ncbi:hypothetical protein ABEB36_003173 [Hypothenemus hampei]|uniref:C2 domain-containing protein n=1 Tax=Hypothenemus hampei TaxID=57062 RepID=A0ABD1F894_HYPHA